MFVDVDIFFFCFSYHTLNLQVFPLGVREVELQMELEDGENRYLVVGQIICV